MSFAVKYEDLVEMEEMTGAELYYKNVNSWVLIDEANVELTETTGEYSNIIVYTFEDYPGTETYFKIRLYKDTTEGREYTEFSIPIDLSNLLG